MNKRNEINNKAIARIGSIYTNSKDIADMFKYDYVTIASFTEIVEALKIKISQRDSQQIQAFYTALNKVFDTIKDSCIEFSKKNESNKVPLSVIKANVEHSIKVVKDNLK